MTRSARALAPRHPGAKLSVALAIALAASLGGNVAAGAALVLAVGLALAIAPRATSAILPFTFLAALLAAGVTHLAGDGWRAGVLASYRVSATLFAFVAFTATTSPRQILVLLRPVPRLALPVAATYRQLPGIRDDYQTILDARRARGHDDESALAAARDALPPLFVRTLRRGRAMNLALAAAGQGGARTSYAYQPWRAADSFVVLFALVVLAGGAVDTLLAVAWREMII